MAIAMAGPDTKVVPGHGPDVVGPSSLWRLVTHRRNLHRPKRWHYRSDIE